MMTYQQSAAKVGFYCKRCKRQLRTRICPLHGVDSTIILEMTSHLPLPPPGESPVAPAVPNGTASAPPAHGQTATRGNGDFADQLFSDLLAETQTATDPGLAGDSEMPGKPKPPNGGTGAPPPLRNGARSTPRIPLNQLHQQHRPRGTGMAIMVVLILACGVTFYSFTYPQYARKSLFGKAEKYFATAQYERALASYQKFVQKYPGDPYLATALGRIDEIAAITAEQERYRQWLGEMMAKAEQAFQENRLLAPRQENAYRYLQEILNQAPSYQPALELQNRLVTRLFDLAARAFEKDQYREALDYYKMILAIRPDDAAVSAQINRALELQNVDEMLRNLGELAEARAEIRRLGRQRAALKSQIRQAQHQLTELGPPAAVSRGNAGEIPARAVGEPAGAASPLPDTRFGSAPAPVAIPPRTAGTTSSEQGAMPTSREAPPARAAASARTEEVDLFQPIANELGIELLFQDEPAPEAAIVEETLIDGGRKEYLNRAKPALPANISADEIPMILAECVVGTDGQVEEVNLVSGAEDRRINQLAVEAFRQFRYKPATYQGKPVRFKALEVLAF